MWSPNYTYPSDDQVPIKIIENNDIYFNYSLNFEKSSKMERENLKEKLTWNNLLLNPDFKKKE